MTKDDRIASLKYSVLQHARKHNNVTYPCEVRFWYEDELLGI